MSFGGEIVLYFIYFSFEPVVNKEMSFFIALMAILFGGDFRTVCAILAEEHFCKFQKEILFIDISIFSTGGIFLHLHETICLFDLILYIPIQHFFSVMQR